VDGARRRVGWPSGAFLPPRECAAGEAPARLKPVVSKHRNGWLCALGGSWGGGALNRGLDGNSNDLVQQPAATLRRREACFEPCAFAAPCSAAGWDVAGPNHAVTTSGLSHETRRLERCWNPPWSVWSYEGCCHGNRRTLPILAESRTSRTEHWGDPAAPKEIHFKVPIRMTIRWFWRSCIVKAKWLAGLSDFLAIEENL